MNEKLNHINERMIYLRMRRKNLLEDLPRLESKRDWADVHASAQTWYHANVAVNQARREIKRIEKEIMELDEDRRKLKIRMELRP